MKQVASSLDLSTSWNSKFLPLYDGIEQSRFLTILREQDRPCTTVATVAFLACLQPSLRSVLLGSPVLLDQLWMEPCGRERARPPMWTSLKAEAEHLLLCLESLHLCLELLCFSSGSSFLWPDCLLVAASSSTAATYMIVAGATVVASITVVGPPPVPMLWLASIPIRHS